MMTAVTPKNSDSLVAAVSVFERLSSPSTVRDSILNRLEDFRCAPEACERLKNARDWSGGNLLHHVASFGSNETAGFVPQLVGLGVDVNMPDRKGASPLFYAVSRREPCANLIFAFMTAGADPNAQSDQLGKSVLAAAILGRAPVDNLVALLENPNTELPEEICLSSGLKMSLDELLEKNKYIGPEGQRLQAVLAQKRK
jgi:ankyrin repeat protein